MAHVVNPRVSVVIPNWNGKDDLPACLDSLLAQTQECRIIVVENGSVDGSLEMLREKYPDILVLVNRVNLGFAGGVNTGIRQALRDSDDFVALFNNDAIADKNWLKELVTDITANDDAGIVTCKLMDSKREHLDSTGDMYTIWGLPYPRGRGEPVSDKYDDRVEVFAASGGASVYRISMLREIGLFDEDFFAYYEDVDISFRAQLAGWKVRYAPEAVAYHQIGMTSGRIHGFTTYQTIKNLPWLLWKNAPATVFTRVFFRFTLAYFSFMASAIQRGQAWPAMKGYFVMIVYLPKKTVEQMQIQSKRKVSSKYIWDIMEHDLPPNAHKLRKLRNFFVGSPPPKQ
jgi:GT2 family glycosyltransferase